MGVMMYLTQACVMNFYHGSNGSLKDTIQGITSHGKQLPQEQKRKLLASKRPEALSAAEREKAILELSDDEDNKEPTVRGQPFHRILQTTLIKRLYEVAIPPIAQWQLLIGLLQDPEAAQLLLDGDEALHEGDLDIALRFYLKGQAIEHDNPQLKSRVKHARRPHPHFRACLSGWLPIISVRLVPSRAFSAGAGYQKSLEREQQQQQALYDQEQLDDEQPFETENPTAK